MPLAAVYGLFFKSYLRLFRHSQKVNYRKPQSPGSIAQDVAERPLVNFHIILCRRPYAVGGTNSIGPGRSSGRLAKLSEVAHRGKEVQIVPKGLSEKAEHLLRRVVILGEAYQREDVPCTRPRRFHGSRRGRVRSCSGGAGRSGACGERR